MTLVRCIEGRGWQVLIEGVEKLVVIVLDVFAKQVKLTNPAYAVFAFVEGACAAGVIVADHDIGLSLGHEIVTYWCVCYYLSPESCEIATDWFFVVHVCSV